MKMLHGFAVTAALSFPAVLPFSAVLTGSAVSRAQAAPRPTSLTVNGYPGEAQIVQVNGRSYVEVESFARITNSTLGFQGTRIVLNLRPQSPATAPQPAPPAASGRTGLSREFVTAAVSALSVIREWRVSLAYAVQHNQPVSDEMTSPYRRNAEAQVAIAVAAARNEPDRSAAALLQNQLGNMRTLSANYQATHDSITNIRNDALDNDPLNAKVVNCMGALAGMGSGGQFQDVPTCH